MTSKLILYQYEICPFCAKVKGILDFYRIPYSTVDVNPLTRSQLLQADVRRKKVPYAIFGDGGGLGDSQVILQAMRERGCVPPLRVNRLEWEKWETFCDKKLSVVLFPNITRSLAESWQTFSYISDTRGLSWIDKILNRTLGSVAMRLANSKLKAKYGICDERESLLAVTQEWMDGISGDFHGGSSPSEIDALIFGVMRAIEGLEAHTWLLSQSPSNFNRWYASMSSIVGARHSIRESRM